MRDIQRLVLDFDGVVIDSLQETFEVSARAYFEGEELSRKENYRTTFERLRFLVGPPEGYLCLWQLISEAGQVQPSSEKFYRQFEKLSVSDKEDFKVRFFEARRVLRADSREAWFELHRLQEGARDVFETCNPDIVTTKDRDSTELLLEHFGLKARSVWGNSEFGTKREAILEIVKASGLTRESFLFVDDHPQHLRDVKTLGVPVSWASWGYGTDSQGFDELESLDELLAILRGSKSGQ